MRAIDVKRGSKERYWGRGFHGRLYFIMKGSSST
jgi:hypothetical protein